MAKAQALEFANKAYGTVTESAANTLTFAQIQTNISIMEKIAWVISRIEWVFTAAQIALLVDDADAYDVSLTASNKISTLALSDPMVIDFLSIRKFVSTAVGWQYITPMWIRDFSQLPGGGLIVAPNPLYLAVKGTGLASAGGVSARIYWSKLEVSPDQYLELLDFYRIVQ